MVRSGWRRKAAVVAAVMMVSPRAFAAALTWDGGAGDGLWNSASNWDTDSVPGSGDSVLFPDPIPGGGAAITLAGMNGVSGLTFKQAYTLGGGTLDLVTPSINASADVVGTINSLVSGTAGVAKTGGGTLVLGGANSFTGVAAVNAGVLSVANSLGLGSAANGASVGLGASMELNGSGLNIAETLSLNGGGVSVGRSLANVANNNTWSGTISLTSGSSIISDSGTLSVDVIDGVGMLYIGGAGNVVVNGSVKTTGSSGLTKVGSGTVTLSGVNTNTGAHQIALGTLKLGASERLNQSVALNVTSSGTFDLAGFTETINTFDGAGVVTSSAAGGVFRVGAGNTNTTFSGVISGQLTLRKQGSGIMTLTGVNSYGGGTYVEAGVLRADANSTQAVLGSLVSDVASGAALEVSGPVSVTLPGSFVPTLSLSGTGISNGGALRKTGSDAVTFGGTVQWRSTPRVNADGGTLVLSGNQNASGTTFDMQFGGAGNIVVSGLIGPTVDRVRKDGSGTLTLSNRSNTFTDGLIITGGTVFQDGDTGETTGASGSTGAAPAGTVANYVQISNGAKLVGTRPTGVLMATKKGVTLGSGGGEIGVTGFNTYGGSITGTGPFTYSGPGTIVTSAIHTYSGATHITGGMWELLSSFSPFPQPIPTSSALTVNSPGVLKLNFNNNFIASSLAGSGTIQLRPFATQSFTFGDSTNTTFSGAFAITGGFTSDPTIVKAGSGTFTLLSNSFTPAKVNINAGTIRLGSSGGGLPDAKAVTIAAGATFDMNGLDDTIGSISSVSSTAAITNVGMLRVGADNSSTSFVGSIAGSVPASSLVKLGSGILTLAQVDVGTLALEIGVVRLLPTTPAARVTSLSVAGGSIVDITTGKLIVRGQAATQVKNLHVAGRLNSGQAINGVSGVAIASANDVDLMTFGGRTVLSSDVLVRYTYLGDADFSGDLDGDDFFRIDAGFNGSMNGWANGDFNYSGTIDADDYFLIDRNYSRNLPALGASEPVGVAAVPEPAAGVMLGMGLLLARRRRVLSNA